MVQASQDNNRSAVHLSRRSLPEPHVQSCDDSNDRWTYSFNIERLTRQRVGCYWNTVRMKGNLLDLSCCKICCKNNLVKRYWDCRLLNLLLKWWSVKPLIWNKGAKLWLKEETFCFNNSSFVFWVYLDEGCLFVCGCVGVCVPVWVPHGCASMCGVLCYATARAQSSNLRSSSLGHLLAGFHWEQARRLDSESIHPHHSFFPHPLSPLTHISHSYFYRISSALVSSTFL